MHLSPPRHNNTAPGFNVGHLFHELSANNTPEVVHVGDLLHTQPAELTGTHSAVHTVTAAIIGLHDVGTTARARFDLLCIYGNRRKMEALG